MKNTQQAPMNHQQQSGENVAVWQRIQTVTLKDLSSLDQEPCYIPSQGGWQKNSAESFDMAQVLNGFMANERKVLLMLGDSGAGKSLFCQQWVKQCWQQLPAKILSNDKDASAAYIPLLISLPSLKEPLEHLMEESLSHCGFSAEEIIGLKQHQRFLLILDGYDELNQLKNLYVTNRLEEWQVKVVMTCRSQYLYHLDNYSLYFMPYVGELAQGGLYSEVFVQPFQSEQIDAYLQAMVPHQPQNTWCDWQTYKTHLNNIPHLSQLIQTPFLLKLAVAVLPTLVERYEAQPLDNRLQLTQTALYDVFIEQWFSRQEEKLKANGRIAQDVDIKSACWSYMQALAQAMKAAGVNQISYEHSSDLFGEPEETSPWDRFLKANDLQTALIQTTCPIIKISENTYALWHASLIDYFASRRMYQSLISVEKDMAKAQSVSQPTGVQITQAKADETLKEGKQEVPVSSYAQTSLQLANNESPMPSLTENTIPPQLLSEFINQHLFTKDVQILQFLADRVQESEEYKQQLFTLIEYSKQTDQIQISAANAITVLNKAHISFAGMDLSNIKIPEADLEGVVFDNTNLTNADMRQVRLKNSFLREAILEGAYLDGADFGELPRLNGHQSALFSLVASSDGKLIASCEFSKDINCWIWDTTTCSNLHVLRTEHHPIKAVFFIPGTTKIMIAGEKGFGIWDALTGQHEDIESFMDVGESRNNIVGATLSPDGNFLAIVTEVNDKFNIRLTSATTLTPAAEFSFTKTKQSKGFFFCEFSPDSTRLAAAAPTEDYLLLIDVNRQQIIKKIIDKKLQSILAMAFTNDSQQLVVSANKQLFFWSSNTGEKLFQTNCNGKVDHGSVALCASRTNAWLAVGDIQGNIYIWDRVRNEIIQSFHGHQAFITHLVILGKDELLCSADQDGIVRLWQLNNFQSRLTKIEGHTSEVTAVLFSSDGREVISAGADGTLQYWDAHYGQHLREIKAHDLDINNLTLSPNGRLLASASADGAVQLWDAGSMSRVGELCSNNYEMNCVAFSPDGKYIATGSYDGIIRLWSLSDKKLEAELKYSENICYANSIQSLAYSPDSLYLLAGNNDGHIFLWEIAKQRLIDKQRTHEKCVSSLIFSPNGNYIASGSYDNAVKLGEFNPQSLPKFNNLSGTKHLGEISQIKFSPDSEMLASASHDGSIWIWEVKLLSPLANLISDGSAVACLSFSPDSKCLVSGHWNRSLKLWEIGNNWKQFTWTAIDENLWKSTGKKIKLRWAINHTLSAEEVNYEKAIGLTAINQKLLYQVGYEEQGAYFHKAMGKLAMVNENGKNIVQQDKHAAILLAQMLVKLHEYTNKAHDENRVLSIEWLYRQHAVAYSARQLLSADSKYAAILMTLFSPETFNRKLLQNIESSKFSNQFVRLMLRHGAEVNGYQKNRAPLNYAIQIGNEHAVKYLVACGADVNKADNKGVTPAMVAAMLGAVEILKYLHSRGARLDYSTTYLSPIYHAVSEGHLEIVRYLESQGINLKQASQSGKAVNFLITASDNGHLALVEYLVQQQFDVNEQDEKTGLTPLSCAIRNGHVEIAQLLLKHGANPLAVNKKGGTAFVFAIMLGNMELMQLLLPYEKNINQTLANEETFLSLAIRYKQTEVACFLIEQGANIRSLSSDGTSCLELSAIMGRAEIVKLLCIKAPDLLHGDEHLFSIIASMLIYQQQSNVEDAEIADTAYYLFKQVKDKNYQRPGSRETFLIKAAQIKSLECIKIICTVNNCNLADKNGTTALIYAAAFNHPGIVEYLLQQGADLHLKQPATGDNALTIAAQEGHREVVDMLCRYKAQLDVQNNAGFSPLIMAAQNGHLGIVNDLLERGANPNLATYKNHTTALASSVANAPNIDITLSLLKYGADYRVKNLMGENLIYLAAGGGFFPIVKFLVENFKEINIQEKNVLGMNAIDVAIVTKNQALAQYLQKISAELDKEKNVISMHHIVTSVPVISSSNIIPNTSKLIVLSQQPQLAETSSKMTETKKKEPGRPEDTTGAKKELLAAKNLSKRNFLRIEKYVINGLSKPKWIKLNVNIPLDNNASPKIKAIINFKKELNMLREEIMSGRIISIGEIKKRLHSPIIMAIEASEKMQRSTLFGKRNITKSKVAEGLRAALEMLAQEVDGTPDTNFTNQLKATTGLPHSKLN